MTVDERIVNLQFNNKEFEKNAQKSMNTLDKLKSALSFKGVSDGFSAISQAAKKVSLSSITVGTKQVKDGFSALEQMAIGALRRIGDQAFSTGERLIKSLTVDQISSGWDKYGEKTRSVASIMSATGMSVEDVTEKLEKLNWYTDETSYAYTDMTNNIGKFTNAGIELDDAITAMIGIGNAAGLAGSSVQDASHAMEGFSGAMAQGYMDRQRWSWIKTAHMDTVQFKEALIDAAVSLGTLEKGADGMYGAFGDFGDDYVASIDNFENAMTKGKWLTRDVMVKALNQFGGTTEKIYEYIQKNGGYTSDAIDAIGISTEDLGLKAFKASQEARTFADAIDSVKDAVSTGWMSTFDMIFGNYEQAKELWTDLANALYDIFAEPGNYRNEQFEIWSKDMKGREILITSLYKIFDTFTTYLETFTEIFNNVLGGWDANTLRSITLAVRKFAIEFEKTTESSTFWKFRAIITQVGTVLNMVRSAVSRFVDTAKGAFQTVFGNVTPFQIVNTALTIILNTFMRIIGAFNRSNRLSRIITGILSAIKGVAKIAKSLYKTLSPYVAKLLPIIIEFLAKIGDAITNLVEGSGIDIFAKIFKTAFDTVMTVVGAVYVVFTTLINVAKKVKNAIVDFLSALISRVKESKNVDKLVTSFKNLGESIKNLFSTITGKDPSNIFKVFTSSGQEAKDSFSWLDGIISVIDNVALALSSFVDGISGAIDNVSSFVSLIKGNSSTTRDIAVDDNKGTIFDIISNRLSTIFDNVDKENVQKGTREYSNSAFTGIFKGLSDAVSNFHVDWEKLKGVSYFIGLIVALFQINKILKSADTFMNNLKKIPLGISDILANFKGITAGIKNIVTDIDKALKENIALKKIALMVESIVALALTMALLSQIPEHELYKGAKYLTLTMVLMVLFLAFLKQLDVIGGNYNKVTDNSRKTIKGLELFSSNVIKINTGALGMAAVVIGTAVLIATIVDSLKKIEELDPESLVRSGTVILTIMGSIVIFIAILAYVSSRLSEVTSTTASNGNVVTHKHSGYFFSMATTILSIASAIKMIVDAIAVLGSMDPTALSDGVISVIKIMGMLTGMLVAMGIIAGVVMSKAPNGHKIGGVMTLIATSLIIVAVAIDLIVPAIAILGALPADKAGQGLVTVGLIMTGLMLFVAIMAMANKYLKVGTLLATAASFVVVAVVINMLVLPIVAIAAATALLGENVGMAVGALGSLMAVILGVMALMVVVLNNSPEVQQSDLLEIASAFVVFSVAMLLIAGALSLMSAAKVGWKDSGILAIMVGIFAAMALLTKIPGFDPDAINQMAAAMVTFSVAVLIIAAAIAALGYLGNVAQEGVNHLIEALAWISAFLAFASILAIAMSYLGTPVLVEAFAEVLKGLGLALVGIAAVFVGFGLSLLLVAKALPLIADGLPPVVDALALLVDLMENHKVTFVIIGAGIMLLTVAIGLLMAALIQNAGPINAILTRMFESFIAFIAHFSGEFKKLPAKTQNTIKMIVLAVVAGLAAATPEMMEQIGQTILKVLKYVAYFVPFLVDALLVVVLKIIEGLADAIRNNSAEIVYALLDVLEALYEVLMDAAYALLRGMGGITGFIEDLLLSFGLNENVAKYAANALTLGSGILSDAMGAGMDDAKQGARNALNDYADAYGLDVRKAGEKMEASTEEATGSLWDKVTGMFGGSGASSVTSLNPLNSLNLDFSDTQDKLSEGLGGLQNALSIPGITDATSDVSQYFDATNGGLVDMNGLIDENGLSMENLVNQNGTNMDIMGGDFIWLSDTAGDAMGGMLQTTAENSENANEAISKNLDDAISNANSKKLTFRQVGVNLIKGLEEGINYEWNFAKGSILSKFQEIVNGAMQTWGERSPSKVFYQIGAYAMIGLANGGDDYGDTALDTFNNAVQSISDAMQIEDYTPTITPIVDLSNARNSANEIDGLFASQTSRLAGINYRLDAKRAELTQNSIYSDKNVISSIKELQGEVNNLNNSMAGMQVVMDTGALVGATVGPMDNALGRRAQRTRRGG